MKALKWLIPFCMVCAIAACNHRVEIDSQALEQQQQAIVNGRIVTGDDHLATLMLAYRTQERYGADVALIYGEHVLFCSSTLITPNYVLTAAHCICEDDGDNETRRKGVYAYKAQSINDIRAEYEIEAFYPHPDYGCGKERVNLDADIALIKLKKPISVDDVRPIAPLPPSLKITASETDGKEGVTVVDVGFGVTNDNADPDDTKHEMMSRLYAYCTISGDQSKHCAETVLAPYDDLVLENTYDFELGDGFMYTRRGQGTHSSVCPGDSGGSMYIWRDGIPYVAGVHSHVSTYNCNLDSVSGSTIVTDYYDFVRDVVTDLPDEQPETDCDDGVDNNNDGRLDCNDPWCFHVPVCLPEICDDKIDNNDNGKVDCDDDECKDTIKCQPEICDDKKDNNDDGKIDCDDAQCKDAPVCQVEICNDKIDNNGDDKIDCDDDACKNDVVCQPEICDDKKDNNGNGLIDCADPQCAEDAHCSLVDCDCSNIQCHHTKCIEICDDGIDNNGDNKVDCDDARCAGAVQCGTEICDDQIDNNGDGIIDCDDPVCASLAHCTAEICDDKIDNNGDGKVDCDDPACAGRYVCNPYTLSNTDSESDNGCSVMVRKSSTAQGWVWLLAAFGLLGLRRKKSCVHKNNRTE